MRSPQWVGATCWCQTRMVSRQLMTGARYCRVPGCHRRQTAPASIDIIVTIIVTLAIVPTNPIYIYIYIVLYILSRIKSYHCRHATPALGLVCLQRGAHLPSRAHVHFWWQRQRQKSCRPRPLGGNLARISGLPVLFA